jgi:hypothetical protein
VQLPPHLVPEEPNIWAGVRTILYTYGLIRYVIYWQGFERTPGNGGKFTIRMLLLPIIVMFLLSAVVALGKATDLAENLQTFLIVPGIVGVICLELIERHRREKRK